MGRREIVVLGLLVVGGIGLRCAFLSRAAIEHFDEGVYASNLWFGAEFSYQYPQRQLYAPPLLPGVIEATLVAERLVSPTSAATGNWGVLLPSLVAGCLTPLVLWWVARCWFGVAAGLAAATLVAFSDFHALYSRAALTDCLLTLFLILSVWLLERAVMSGLPRTIVSAGCVTGLAWWTKYNGWLPLAISGGGLALQLLVGKPVRIAARKLLVRWGSVAAIAFLSWCPFLISLQSSGGYSAIAANHRQYVVGPRGWLESASRQHANLRFLDGPVTLAGLAVAAMALQRSGNGPPIGGPRRRWAAVAGCAAIPVAAAAVFGSDVVFLALGTLGITRRAWDCLREQETPDHSSPAGIWFLASWFFGLLVLTPLYHAYPRLLLPWLASAWLGTALGLRDWAKFCLATTAQTMRRNRMAMALAVGAILLALAVLVSRGQRIAAKGVPAWSERTGMRAVAAEIITAVKRFAAGTGQPWENMLICVYGEPSLFYHLRALGWEPAIPVAQIPDMGVPNDPQVGVVLLVAGPHANRTPEFQRQWQQVHAQFERLLVSTYQPSVLVFLDDYDPRHDLETRPPPEEHVSLYVRR